MLQVSLPIPGRRGTRGPAPTADTNLRDVARLAGVSPATASRVFTGKAVVAEPTRAKVLAAAGELGYVVNGLAQSMLGTGRRHLGFVTSLAYGPATAELINGAESVTASHDSLFLLALAAGDPEREAAAIAAWCQQRVTGVLLAAPAAIGKEADAAIASYAAALTAVGATLVLVGQTAAAPGVLSVNYDQVGGMRQAVRLLIDHGHTRIAFLGWANTPAANQRFLGYSLEMKNAGLTIDSSMIVECPNEIADAHLATLLLLGRPTPPTAVVCLSDQVATGVYRAARDLGVTIPDQLAVVGFEDWPCAADLTPPLASVQVPFRDIGVRAAELALGLADVNEPVELPTTLVVRESAG